MEYKWRMWYVKFFAIFTGVFAALMVLVIAVVGGEGWPIWLLLLPICVLPFGGYVLYYWLQCSYLKKKAPQMPIYVVKLENPVVSYWYRGSVSFNVKLIHDNQLLIAATSPMFASWGISKYYLNEYSGKWVRVWYNSKSNKAYIIDVVPKPMSAVGSIATSRDSDEYGYVSDDNIRMAIEENDYTDEIDHDVHEDSNNLDNYDDYVTSIAGSDGKRAGRRKKKNDTDK